MIWAVFLLLFVSVESKVNFVQYNQTDELVFVQIIFRHGSRNPCSTYPTDPHRNETNWPEGFGQLTKKGKQQAYELGKFLRRRYESYLLNDHYSPDEVFTLSSEFDRTKGTAARVLSGFFPPKSGQKNENYVVHYFPKKLDHLLKHKPACPRYKKEWKNFINSSKIQRINHVHRSLYHYLEKRSGKSIRTVTDVKDLHDTLSVEKFLNKTIPKWAEDKFEEMEHLGQLWLRLTTGNTALKKLYSGFLLKDILDRFRKKRQSKLSPDLSIWLYSAHDVTIAGVLHSLGLLKPHIPSYTASLIFEFYESSNGHYIQVFYRDEKVEKPKPLNIPNCGEKCHLSRFYHLYGNILPSSYRRECHIPN